MFRDVLLICFLFGGAVYAQETLVKKVVSGVLEKDGRVLLLERSRDEQLFPGFFNLPGGRLEPGEDETTAVVREFKEETGLDVLPLKAYNRWGWNSWVNGNEIRFELTSYLVEVAGVSDVTLSREHVSFVWASKDDLKRLKISKELAADLEIAFSILIGGACEAGLRQNDEFSGFRGGPSQDK